MCVQSAFAVSVSMVSFVHQNHCFATCDLFTWFLLLVFLHLLYTKRLKTHFLLKEPKTSKRIQSFAMHLGIESNARHRQCLM